jgi:hypothetical protein
MTADQLKEFVCAKDLARIMGLTPFSVKRWWQKLNVAPTVQGHASHRWSPEDAEKLVSRWKRYWKKRSKKIYGNKKGRSHPRL